MGCVTVVMNHDRPVRCQPSVEEVKQPRSDGFGRCRWARDTGLVGGDEASASARRTGDISLRQGNPGEQRAPRWLDRRRDGNGLVSGMKALESSRVWTLSGRS
jgi:hypothetical protein